MATSDEMRFALLTNCELGDVDEFNLGSGIVIRQRQKALQGTSIRRIRQLPDSGNWRNEPSQEWDSSDYTSRLVLEIREPGRLPKDIAPKMALRWILFMLYLRGYEAKTVLYSDVPFARMLAGAPGTQEFPPRPQEEVQLDLTERVWKYELEHDDLSWIQNYWRTAWRLGETASLAIAMEAIDACRKVVLPAYGMMVVWSGIEALFQVQLETTYRLSTLVAAYLEPPGPERVTAYKAIKELYKARSAVSHGRKGTIEKETVVGSLSLLRRIVIKAIEENDTPDCDLLMEQVLVGC